MKLNIHVTEDQVLNTHTNVMLQDPESLKQSLDEVCDDAQATEIVLNEVLEFVAAADIITVLNIIMKKLRKNGCVIVTGMDALAIAQDYGNRLLSLEQFNVYLHGGQEASDPAKRTNLTAAGITNFLRDNMKYKINETRFENYSFSVKATR